MMRDIFALQQEIFETELTLDEVMNWGYSFPTTNKKTIERIYYEVREEVRQKQQNKKELKEEFKAVAFSIFLTGIMLGVILTIILQ